jgi:hypothetical protein
MCIYSVYIYIYIYIYIHTHKYIYIYIYIYIYLFIYKWNVKFFIYIAMHIPDVPLVDSYKTILYAG